MRYRDLERRSFAARMGKRVKKLAWAIDRFRKRKVEDGDKWQKGTPWDPTLPGR